MGARGKGQMESLLSPSKSWDVRVRKGFIAQFFSLPFRARVQRACVTGLKPLTSWAWVSPLSADIDGSTRVPLRFLEMALLTLTKGVMLPSITSFVEHASPCFMWSKQTSVKDVSTLNLAFILHSTCQTLGVYPFLWSVLSDVYRLYSMRFWLPFRYIFETHATVSDGRAASP